MSAEPEATVPETEPGPTIGPDESTPFRQQLAGDVVNTFLDLEFFGEIHMVAKRMVKVVIDEDIYRKASAARGYGVTQSGFVMFCRESELDRQPEGTQLDIDGRLYTVESWRTDEGLHEIALVRLAGY